MSDKNKSSQDTGLVLLKYPADKGPRLLKGLVAVVLLAVVAVQVMRSGEGEGRVEVEVSDEVIEKVVEMLSNVTTKAPLSKKAREKAFKENVERPHKKLVSKFPSHPNIVISSLLTELSKEERKNKAIGKDIGLLKNFFGLSSDKSSATESSGGKTRIARSLKSVQESVEMCPETSPLLLGPLVVNQTRVDLEQVRRRNPNVRRGGWFQPEQCRARQKVAFIIPFRDREPHLGVWLAHMHPILQRQQLQYVVLVVEQAKPKPFNRAALMNVGFAEANKIDEFDCFVFHDVDLVPEDDRNVYRCWDGTVLHMAVAVTKWKYRLIYRNYTGGITAIAKDTVKKINGFSNSFYGWGGEDDDLNIRLKRNNFTIKRYPGNIGRYTMLYHDWVEENPNLQKMMEKSKDGALFTDGLSNLKYKVLNKTEYPLYTKVRVQLPPPPPTPKKSWFEVAGEKLLDPLSGIGKSMADQIVKGTELLVDWKEMEEGPAKNKIY